MNSKKANIDAIFSASITQNYASSALPQCLVVALSGGIDSVVLLALAAVWRNSGQGAVRAIYIDHGLQAQSVQWGVQCATFCDALDVDFQVIKVAVDLESGLSPEAAARDARYAALQRSLADGEYLCTAHHANDQAETLLLQLLRGAGVQGLAAMPESRAFGKGCLIRPLLGVTSDEIARYAQLHELEWCEDPSNQDERYDRNFIRHEIMPLLTARWPQVAGNLTRSAAHCAEAASIADDLALIDLAGSEFEPKQSIDKINALSSTRKRNALRCWIKHQGFLAPSQRQLQQIISDLLDSSSDSHGRVSFGQASVARYRDEIFIAPRGSFEPIADFEYQWPDSQQPLYLPELDWHLNASEHANLRAAIVQNSNGQLLVRNRRGGERWIGPGAEHSASVKTLLQTKGIPPWDRSRIVFVYLGDRLIDIVGPIFAL